LQRVSQRCNPAMDMHHTPASGFWHAFFKNFANRRPGGQNCRSYDAGTVISVILDTLSSDLPVGKGAVPGARVGSF